MEVEVPCVRPEDCEREVETQVCRAQTSKVCQLQTVKIPIVPKIGPTVPVQPFTTTSPPTAKSKEDVSAAKSKDDIQAAGNKSGNASGDDSAVSAGPDLKTYVTDFSQI